MCRLICELNGVDFVRGYKVAIQKNDKYYSPAMGIEYKTGPVEIPKKQIKLCNYFIDILNDDAAFSELMVGRTAIFLNKEHAIDMKNKLSKYNLDGRLVILYMGISNSLMFGEYSGNNVVAGKNIIYFYPMN